MVLKKSKFGSNTGNTLRRVGGCSTKGSFCCILLMLRSTKSLRSHPLPPPKTLLVSSATTDCISKPSSH